MDRNAFSDIPGGIDAWIARSAGIITSTNLGDEEEPTKSPTNGRVLRDAEKQVSKLERRRSALQEKIAASSDPTEQKNLNLRSRCSNHENENP